MIERGLEPDFPPTAQQELAALSRPADATDDVRDLRDRLWASIDNDDSRDLDQLTVAESLAGGRVRILVAVADVDALVRKGSAIDGHASHNTTSDFMIAANGVTATYLESKRFPSLRQKGGWSAVSKVSTWATTSGSS
jgi:exoribonuclease-2